ncbi:MAG: septal ring lytic transglycosylase RlpA family protein, partial [Pseudomonadota bacterium]
MTYTLLKLNICLVVALLLGACATTSPVYKPRDAAPRVTPQTEQQLARLPDPVVKKEPRSRYGNGPVYTVLGKSYRVMDSASGYRKRGIASWYGTKFHGRKTSSQEPYDIFKLTAAHKHLPIPSYVRVTNLHNGRHTIVRVNDRGPFHDDRIIDLSYAAAVKLDFHKHGTAQVLVEVVEPEPQIRRYIVQAGSFSEFQRADRSHRELQDKTGLPAVIVKASDGLYKVHLGPVTAGAETERVRALLLAANYGPPHL